MKKKELQELRTKPLAEKQRLLVAKRKEASRQYIDTRSGQAKDVHGYKKTRRDIAQVLTLINEDQLRGNKA